MDHKAPLQFVDFSFMIHLSLGSGKHGVSARVIMELQYWTGLPHSTGQDSSWYPLHTAWGYNGVTVSESLHDGKKGAQKERKTERKRARKRRKE